MASSPDPANPYEPPADVDWTDKSDAPRFRPLAVFIGWLADIGFTMVTSMALGVVAAIWFIGQGVTLDELEAAVTASHWIQGIGMGLGACGTVVGAYIAVWLGKTMPMVHASVLGVVSLLTSLVPLLLAPDMQPVWVELSGLVLVIPAALLGGWLRARQR